MVHKIKENINNQEEKNLRVNIWCKLYIISLIVIQEYFLYWAIPVSFPPLTKLGILCGFIVLISTKSNTLGKAGKYITLGLLCLQLLFVGFFLLWWCFWTIASSSSLSFDIYVIFLTLCYLIFGIILYIKLFWIVPSKHKYKNEKIISLIILAMILIVLWRFSGGPDISKSQLSSSAPPFAQKQIKKLYSWNPKARAKAAEMLGIFPKYSISAIPFLVSMLNDDVAFTGSGGDSGLTNKTPGKEASSALRSIGEPAAADLIALLESNDPELRIKAAETFSTNMGENAFYVFTKCLKDNDLRIRIIGLKGLSGFYEAIRDPRVVEYLTIALEDPDVAIREAALKEIYDITDPRIIDPLIKAIKGENAFLLDTIESYLKKITHQNFGSDKEAWQEWWQNNQNEFIQDRYLNDKKYISNVISYSLRELENPLDVISLSHALDKENINTKRSAIWMLDKIGSPESVESLIKVMRFDKRSVQVAAARALFPITGMNFGTNYEGWDQWWDDEGDRFIQNPDRYIMDHQDSIYEALLYCGDKGFTIAGKIGTPAAPSLLKIAEKGDDDQRSKALSTLSKIKDLRAVEPLIESLKSEDFSVRNSATISLTRLTGQDFYHDHEQYQKWWNKHKKDFGDLGAN